MPMTCTCAQGALTLLLTGEVDHHGAKELIRAIDAQLEQTLARQVTVDLSGVSFMDSSGIAVLLRIYRRVGELGGRISVRAAPEQAMKVLRTAGLTRLMQFE